MSGSTLGGELDGDAISPRVDVHKRQQDKLLERTQVDRYGLITVSSIGLLVVSFHWVSFHGEFVFVVRNDISALRESAPPFAW